MALTLVAVRREPSGFPVVTRDSPDGSRRTARKNIEAESISMKCSILY